MKSTSMSVADAMSRAHAALIHDLRKLEEAVRPAASIGVTRLLVRLGQTEAHLTDHFRFEEENGYMDTVRKRDPSRERLIEQLAEDHRQLAQSLTALIKTASAATKVNDSLRRDVQRWIERVLEHETRENDLVQEVFNMDIGAED